MIRIPADIKFKVEDFIVDRATETFEMLISCDSIDAFAYFVGLTVDNTDVIIHNNEIDGIFWVNEYYPSELRVVLYGKKRLRIVS